MLNNRLCGLAQSGIIARANGPTEAGPKRHVEAKHPSEPSIEGTYGKPPSNAAGQARLRNPLGRNDRDAWKISAITSSVASHQRQTSDFGVGANVEVGQR